MKSDRKPLVTSTFRDRESADSAYRDLRARGYSDDEIHVMMSDETRKRHFGDDQKMGNKALEGTAVGGAVGGAVGATLVAIMAAGAAIAVPGVGLVIAGPLAGALAGGATGAAAGGLMGMLVGAGIPEERARLYERDIKEGKIVMGVHPRHDEDADYFERDWQSRGENVYR